MVASGPRSARRALVAPTLPDPASRTSLPVAAQIYDNLAHACVLRTSKQGAELLASLRLCANVPGQWAVQTALGGYQSIRNLTEPGGRLIVSNIVLDGEGRVTDLEACLRAERVTLGAEPTLVDRRIDDDVVIDKCQEIPLGRLGTVEEVANLTAFLASEESSYMTGQALNITGGQTTEI